MNKRLHPGLAIAVIVVIASVIGIGIWLYSADQKENLTAENQMATEAQTQSEVQKATADPEEIEIPAKESTDVNTEGWKTYRSTNHGYTFQIPGDWIIDTNNPDEVSANSPVTELLQKQTANEPVYIPDDFEIFWYKDLNALAESRNINKVSDLEDFIKNALQIADYSHIAFDNHKAYAFSMGGYSLSYCILYNKHASIYWIEVGNRDKSTLTSIDKQIITSFHFD